MTYLDFIFKKILLWRNICFWAGMIFLLLGGVMDAHAKDTDKILIYDGTAGKPREVDRISKTNEEWKKILTPEQFRITRLKGTEVPFKGQCELPAKGEEGIYQCVSCGTDLFLLTTKFESGTGWPSFYEPVSDLNIRLKKDDSFGMRRVEVLCARCDAHLGHVFDDGPPPTGKRYCINAVALKFTKLKHPKKERLEKAAFGAGCFWGVQVAFDAAKGVVATTVGFMGGTTKNPTYKQVCTNTTGHAETVEILYDPDVVSYEALLDIFWKIHDPTTLDRQGSDVGSQYRSVIFYYTSGQKKAAFESKEKLQKSHVFKNPVVTEIVAAQEFTSAEEYHQGYYKKQGLRPSCPLGTRGSSI